MPITPYVFPETGQPVRTVTIDGQPWFVGRDVTTALGYANGRMAISNLPERMKSSVTLADGTPGNPHHALVSEPGVYRLVMRSTLPSAERFQDWLAEDVIPTLRRTGAYNPTPGPTSMPDLRTPAGVLALAEQLTVTARELVDADARIAELAPKAAVADQLMTADTGDVLVRQAAKLLGWQERRLRDFLIEEHLVYRRYADCGAAQYDHYAQHAAHFHAVECIVQHRRGPCAHYVLHVRPAGLDLIHRRIASRQPEPRAALRRSAP